MAQDLYTPSTDASQDDKLGSAYDDSPSTDAPAADTDNTPNDSVNDGAEDLASREAGAGSSPKSPESTEKKDAKAADAEGLGAAEGLASAADTLGAGFNPAGSLAKRAAFTAFLGRNKRKAAFGGGAAGIIIALLTFGFFALSAVEIETIVQKEEDHFFASTNSAVENESQTLLDHYFAEKVLPSYRSCGTTITSKCRVPNSGLTSNPVLKMYNAWADARLEGKLATNYNIAFKYDTASKSWYLKAPGTAAAGDRLGASPTSSGLDAEFQSASKPELRNAVKEATKNETLFKKMLFRYKVGTLLSQKYAVVRCISFCGVQDSFKDFKDKKTTSWKILFTQRVITPLNASRGVLIECLLDTTCDPTRTEPTASEPGTSELVGAEENPDTQGKIRTTLTDLAKSYGIVDKAAVEKMIKDYEAISEKGFQKFAIAAVLEKVGFGDAASQVTDAAPVIGWIKTGATIINALNKAGPAVVSVTYLANSSAAVNTYSMYRTYADELHTGHIDSTELGSAVNSLGAGDPNNKTDPLIGGTATAEQTPLYSYLFKGGASNSGGSTALLNGLLPARAYAATSSSGFSGYPCDDGKQVPAGKLVCNEEVLGQSPAVLGGSLDSIHTILNQPGISIITKASGIIASLSGIITNSLGGLISNIPGAGTLSNLVNSVLSPLFTDLMKLIPTPFGTNMGGGRMFDGISAGADVAGQNSAQLLLGGKELTPAEVATITNGQETTTQQTFARRPLFARIFSTDTSYSMVSRMAMSLPLNMRASLTSGFSSLLSNPVGSFAKGFDSLFSAHSSAAGAVIADPFMVKQYGYTAADLAKIGDPAAYWDKHCTDNAAHAYQNDADYASTGGGAGWSGEAAANVDPATNQPVNKTTNPCLLIKTVTGAAGAVFDKSLLSDDELGTSTDPSSSSSPSGASGSTFVTTNTSYVFKNGVTAADVLKATTRAKEYVKNPSAACGGSCLGRCDHMAAKVWGYSKGSGYAFAKTHWATMVSGGYAHPKDTNIPIGALMFWNTTDGHIGVYMGDGLIATTDRPTDGTFGIVSVDVVNNWLGSNNYLGWSDPVFAGPKDPTW